MLDILDMSLIINQIQIVINLLLIRNLKKMKDTFAVVQCGPDSFWLVSTGPVDEETRTPESIDELVFGEARKLTDAW